MSGQVNPRAINNLEVRHLRLLVIVAEMGSIRGAATALGLAQPNVSQQLQRIERQFAAPIFQRSVSGVVATEYGTEILECAAEILERIESIGAIRPITVLRHRYFDLDVSAVGGKGSAQRKKVWESVPTLPEDGVRDVLKGTADIFVGVHWPHTPWPDFLGLTAVNLFSTRMHVLVRDDHPAIVEENGCVDLSDLKAEQWIVRHSQHTTELECEFFGFSPSITQVDTPTARDELLAEGAVCFVNPQSSIPPGFRSLSYRGASPIHHILHYHRNRIGSREVNEIVRTVHAGVDAKGITPELLIA